MSSKERLNPDAQSDLANKAQQTDVDSQIRSPNELDRLDPKHQNHPAKVQVYTFSCYVILSVFMVSTFYKRLTVAFRTDFERM